MFSLLRIALMVLALPFLMVTATADRAPESPQAVSLHTRLIFAENKPGAVKIPFAHAKRITAEVEDGPEGEEAPLVSLVRGYDGDDQIDTSLFFLISFSLAEFAPDRASAAVLPTHFVCASLPTGPPAA